MTEYIAKGVVYMIEDDWPDVKATRDGTKVGRLEMKTIDDDFEGEVRVNYIEVDENHRRLGIAKAMVKEAVEMHGKFTVPGRMPVCEGRRLDSDEYYTEEGARLFEACLACGIITEAFLREESSDDMD